MSAEREAEAYYEELRAQAHDEEEREKRDQEAMSADEKTMTAQERWNRLLDRNAIMRQETTERQIVREMDEHAEARARPLRTLLQCARGALSHMPDEAVSNPLPPWGGEGLTNWHRLLEAIDAALAAEARLGEVGR